MSNEEKVINLLYEQNVILENIKNILQQQYEFWNKITSEEYFNEIVAKDGINLPK